MEVSDWGIKVKHRKDWRAVIWDAWNIRTVDYESVFNILRR